MSDTTPSPRACLSERGRVRAAPGPRREPARALLDRIGPAEHTTTLQIAA